MAIKFIGGLLLLLGIMMIFIGRPRGKESERPFLRSPFIAQLYAVGCLAVIVIGIALTAA